MRSDNYELAIAQLPGGSPPAQVLDDSSHAGFTDEKPKPAEANRRRVLRDDFPSSSVGARIRLETPHRRRSMPEALKEVDHLLGEHCLVITRPPREEEVAAVHHEIERSSSPL